MAEYIERESAIKSLLNDAPEQVSYSREDATDCIRYMDAADVAPVRHGRWIMKHRRRGGFRRYTGIDDMGEQHTIIVDERVEYDDRYCSECGKQSADNFLNYCPNCGAKMDLEADNHA